jgi:hypothetical protein
MYIPFWHVGPMYVCMTTHPSDGIASGCTRAENEGKEEKDTYHHDSSRIKSLARKKKKTLDPWDWGMRRQQHSPALLRSLFPRRRRVELSPRQRPLSSMIRFQSDPPPRSMAAKRPLPIPITEHSCRLQRLTVLLRCRQ